MTHRNLWVNAATFGWQAGVDDRVRFEVASAHEMSGDGFDLDAFERDLVFAALQRAGGNKTHAARLLGITRRRMYSLLASYGDLYGDSVRLAERAGRHAHALRARRLRAQARGDTPPARARLRRSR